MKRFIKTISVIFITALAFFAFASCESKSESDGKINVVCTVFPQYDWTKSIIGDADGVKLSLICKSGTDIHSYQPTADDIIAISGCDLLICIGGEADKWAIDTAKSRGIATVSLLDALGDDIHAEDEASLAEEHHHDHDHGEASDEHIWLSLKNAIRFTEIISAKLSAIDGENAEAYRKNAEAYSNALSELDGRYEAVCSNAKNKVMVVADRFPFIYLTGDYGIKCFAAFPGCSSDTDATPKTIITLADAVDEYGLDCIAVTENTTGKTANAVISNTKSKNQRIITLDSMQSVSEKDIKNGETYLKIAERNLTAFETLLG